MTQHFETETLIFAGELRKVLARNLRDLLHNTVTHEDMASFFLAQRVAPGDALDVLATIYTSMLINGRYLSAKDEIEDAVKKADKLGVTVSDVVNSFIDEKDTPERFAGRFTMSQVLTSLLQVMFATDGDTHDLEKVKDLNLSVYEWLEREIPKTIKMPVS